MLSEQWFLVRRSFATYQTYWCLCFESSCTNLTRMEGVKHAWRNAACLLFVTGPFRYCPNSAVAMRPLVEGYSRGKTPPTIRFMDWDKTEVREDMEMMFVQRHSKAGFMANMHVFPGGVLDEADYSPKWLTVFSHLLTPFSLFTNNHNLPLYSQVPSDRTPIAGEVAFRICAIREMFEEAGVLLVRDKSDDSPLSGVLPGSFAPAVKLLSETDREHWRERVHNNAEEFLTLCNELNCVPDIWSLIEWSNWLTPRNHKRRYDTVFYMVLSGTKPTLHPDGAEVTKSAWMSPSVALRKANEGELMLAPPQFAELIKIYHFPSSPCLHSFAINNSTPDGTISRILSARILTKDNLLVESLTNLDDLYPRGGAEDWKTEIQQPQAPHLWGKVDLVLSQEPMCEYRCPTHTASELLELSHTHSRLEVHGFNDARSYDNTANFQRIPDHIEHFQSLYGSKL